MSRPHLKGLAGALADAGLTHRYEIAEAVEALVRAVACEEIERALGPAKTTAAMDAAERTVRAMEPDASRAGVRVSPNWDGTYRISVDREFLLNVLADQFGWGIVTSAHALGVAARLGLTLSDGGTDD